MLFPQSRHQQKRCHAPDISLHRLETNQFPIKLIQHFVEIGIPMRRADIYKSLLRLLHRRRTHDGICV